jgi:hypothetical protein
MNNQNRCSVREIANERTKTCDGSMESRTDIPVDMLESDENKMRRTGDSTRQGGYK